MILLMKLNQFLMNNIHKTSIFINNNQCIIDVKKQEGKFLRILTGGAGFLGQHLCQIS